MSAKNRAGFSFIELTLVMAISLILVSLALSVFRDLAPAANLAVEKQTAAAVVTGISFYHLDPARGNCGAFPAQLDSAAVGSTASNDNPFFDLVLDEPIKSGWKKTGTNSWEAPSGNCYSYDGGVCGVFCQVSAPTTTTTSTTSTTTTRTTTTSTRTTVTATTSTTHTTAPTSTVTTTTGMPVSTTTTSSTTSSTAVAAPRVQTTAATGISSSAATLNLTYNFGGAGSGSVQFRYKKSTDVSWTYTSWAGASGSGTYASSIGGLSGGSTYYFVARLMYSSTQIEGSQLSFLTN